MSDGLSDYFRGISKQASEDPMFEGAEVDAWEKLLFDEIIDEETQELKCSCGAWSVYGRFCSLQFHQDYCDLVRRD